MTVQEATELMRKVRADHRKIVRYPSKLLQRYNEAMANGQVTEANNIYDELTAMQKDIERVEVQLTQFMQVVENNEARARSRKQRQQIAN